MTGNEGNESILSDEHMSTLNERERVVHSNEVARFVDYLKTKGKDPVKETGYAEGSVNERVSRFRRMMEWFWNEEHLILHLTPEDGDTINEALKTDSLRRVDGEQFSDGSKRKLNDTLRNWFEFKEIDWEPEYAFSDGKPKDQADPFRKEELKQIWMSSLSYKSVPSYNNLTPDERDRTKAHIAQELGKSKDEVIPDDWDKLNKCWKIPSIIRTTRSKGWRPCLVGRMKVDWYERETGEIHIPEGKAPKNDASWRATLSDEGADTLERWLEQRKLRSNYDDRDEMWLNREGNPYNSDTLNDLLDDLLDDAGINSRGRKLVWYSFRHSVGTHVHDNYKDLEVVAEQLRQKSISSAERYVHPLPELMRDAAEIM